MQLFHGLACPLDSSSLGQLVWPQMTVDPGMVEKQMDNWIIFCWISNYIHSIEHSAFAQNQSRIPIDPKNLPKSSKDLWCKVNLFFSTSFFSFFSFFSLSFSLDLMQTHSKAMAFETHSISAIYLGQTPASFLLSLLSGATSLLFLSAWTSRKTSKPLWNAALNSNPRKLVAQRIAARLVLLLVPPAQVSAFNGARILPDLSLWNPPAPVGAKGRVFPEALATGSFS